jgi:hypothetical protein
MVWLNEYKTASFFITDWTDVIIPRMNGLDLYYIYCFILIVVGFSVGVIVWMRYDVHVYGIFLVFILTD